MTFEKALHLAHLKILAPGYKPEDYYCVSDKYPIQIAKIILEEAKHIMHMERIKKSHPKVFKYLKENYESYRIPFGP